MVGGLITVFTSKGKQVLKFLKPVIEERLRQIEKYGKDYPGKRVSVESFLVWQGILTNPSEARYALVVHRQSSGLTNTAHSGGSEYSDAYPRFRLHPHLYNGNAEIYILYSRHLSDALVRFSRTHCIT